MINISEIVATWPEVDGWRISPGVEWCKAGRHVRVGSNVKVGDTPGAYSEIKDYVQIADHVRIERAVRIGEFVNVGRFVKIGKWTKIGDHAQIGQHAIIGRAVQIGQHAEIGPQCKIGDRAEFIAHVGNADGYSKALCALDGVAWIGSGDMWDRLSSAIRRWGAHPIAYRSTMCLMGSAKALADLHGLKWE